VLVLMWLILGSSSQS